MDNEKLNILKLLIDAQEQQLSIRQIALQRKINYKSAYQAVHKLFKEGIVDLSKHGNIKLCKFNRHFNATVFAVEDYRRHVLLQNKSFKVLYQRLKTINQQYILLLFGSHAKKTQTKNSDIDLLLISNQPEAIKTQVQLLPLPIHLTAISCADFQAMLKSREFTVVSEAVKKNIIFFGGEDYYRMIENAQ